jgi:hypothetical protein
MEEVAALAVGAGTCVGIMARGRLRCLAPLPALLAAYAPGALLRVAFRGRGGAWERAHAAVCALFPLARGSAVVDPGRPPHFARLGAGDAREESGWATFSLRVGPPPGGEVAAGEAFARMRSAAAERGGVEAWALRAGAGDLETAFNRVSQYYN